MNKSYEYRLMEVHWVARKEASEIRPKLCVRDERLNWKSLTDMLNSYGQDGWKCVGILQTPEIAGRSPNTHYDSDNPIATYTFCREIDCGND